MRLCRDARIGREVALKVVRDGGGPGTDLRSRFLREARVQGQLEHPAVVPVYDLGVGPDGAEYFTMKRVRGASLAEILERLRREHEETRREYSQHKILSALLQVCLAMDFAHRRGVIHRDLKPANVMLGDFGEVYVLDWGLARVLDGHTTASIDVRTSRPTGQGTILGTPGYMAPEQAMSPESIDGRADVYALGSMLFEALTLLPLHVASTLEGLVASTLRGADARASVRAPERDIAPELEAACVRATALDPGRRYASARDLAVAIEAYLEGDRDVALRRRLAEEHTRVADQEADSALSGEDEARTRALREIGRSLALDPTGVAPLRTLARLLAEPPRTVPREVAAEAAVADAERHRFGARVGSYAFLSFPIYLPFYFWMGVRDWRLLIAAFGPFLAAGFALLAASAAMDDRTRSARTSIAFWLALLGAACSAGMFGPFVIAPTLAAALTFSFCMLPDRRRRAWTIAGGALAIAAPILVEWSGALAPSYVFESGSLTILPRTNEIPRAATFATLLVVSLASGVIPAVFLGRVRDQLTDAERDVLLQKWQLRRLVPE